MAVYRLRKVWPEYRARVRIVFRALSLELKNLQPTPKPVLDIEIMLMARQERELPIWPWKAPAWEYVPTLLPAFEAEKAAEQQGDDAAWEYAWHVRHAFFAGSRTICMRFVLGEIAREAGLDVDRFLAEWDSGRFREQVIAESHRGWEVLKVAASPTFILPSGKQITNPAADIVQWGPNHRVLAVQPADCPPGDCLGPYRAMLDEAIAAGG